MPGQKATTVSAVSAMATALAAAQGTNVVITLENVKEHMDWLRDPRPTPSPLSREKTKFVIEAMNFLLSDNAPRA